MHPEQPEPADKGVETWRAVADELRDYLIALESEAAALRAERDQFIAEMNTRAQEVRQARSEYLIRIESLKSEAAALRARVTELTEALEAALPWVEHSIPPSCGRCGTPDAICDMQCAEAAEGAAVLARARAALRAQEKGE